MQKVSQAKTVNERAEIVRQYRDPRLVSVIEDIATKKYKKAFAEHIKLKNFQRSTNPEGNGYTHLFRARANLLNVVNGAISESRVDGYVQNQLDSVSELDSDVLFSIMTGVSKFKGITVALVARIKTLEA